MSETNDATTTETTTESTGTADTAFAEIKALADELGITPGQLKGRLEASRKWEERAKANKSAADELDKLKAASLSETEKAVAAARDEGRKEALTAASQKLARAELKAAAAGRMPEAIIAALDVTQFLDDDGEPDTDAIAKFVEANAPAPSDDEKDAGKPALPDFGQGQRGKPARTAGNDPLLAEISQKIGLSR